MFDRQSNIHDFLSQRKGVREMKETVLPHTDSVAATQSVGALYCAASKFVCLPSIFVVHSLSFYQSLVKKKEKLRKTSSHFKI